MAKLVVIPFLIRWSPSVAAVDMVPAPLKPDPVLVDQEEVVGLQMASELDLEQALRDKVSRAAPLGTSLRSMLAGVGAGRAPQVQPAPALPAGMVAPELRFAFTRALPRIMVAGVEVARGVRARVALAGLAVVAMVAAAVRVLVDRVKQILAAAAVEVVSSIMAGTLAMAVAGW